MERYRSRTNQGDIQGILWLTRRPHQLAGLADTTGALVRENLRVSQSLYDNDKLTIDAVYRSEAEVSKVEVQQARAKNMLEASRAYFNFLLNRSLDAAIELLDESPQPLLISLEEAGEMALQTGRSCTR